MRDCTVVRASAPHGLWLLDKALSVAAEMDAGPAGRLGELLARTGGGAVTAIRLARGLKRHDYVLVLN